LERKKKRKEKSIQKSSRGSSIGCESRFMKRRSQDRIPLPPTLVWTCQKKIKKKKKKYTKEKLGEEREVWGSLHIN
jgi:hypothetical protein